MHISRSKQNVNSSYFKKNNIKQQISFKPSGIWISDLFGNNKQSWADWCYEEDMLKWIDPELCKFYAFKIINDSNLILKLDTMKKVDMEIFTY